MLWFEKLMGFKEENPDQVRQNLEYNNGLIHSKVNGKSYQSGLLTIPTLKELRNKLTKSPAKPGKLTVQEVVGDVQQFHLQPENNGALFQAASQFNLLEMVKPTVTPEEGVGIYDYDKTQGPACAIACGAGTIYRNYFVEVNGEIGQSANNQIDCLDEIGAYFDNVNHNFWAIQNGYAFATEVGLKHITSHISSLTPKAFDELKGLLKIGIHWNTQVTLLEQGENQLVSQAYCSALPVGYSNISADLWEAFAKLVLEATYEATLIAGLLNAQKTGNNKVLLTLVGGGVFANKSEWLVDAIVESLKKFKNADLEVWFVSYGGKSGVVDEIIQKINA